MLSSHLLSAGLHPLLLHWAPRILTSAVHQPLSLHRRDQPDQGVLATDGARGGESFYEGSTSFSILQKFSWVFFFYSFFFCLWPVWELIHSLHDNYKISPPSHRRPGKRIKILKFWFKWAPLKQAAMQGPSSLEAAEEQEVGKFALALNLGVHLFHLHLVWFRWLRWWTGAGWGWVTLCPFQCGDHWKSCREGPVCKCLKHQGYPKIRGYSKLISQTRLDPAKKPQENAPVEISWVSTRPVWWAAKKQWAKKQVDWSLQGWGWFPSWKTTQSSRYTDKFLLLQLFTVLIIRIKNTLFRKKQLHIKVG